MPEIRAARIVERWADNPATCVGAEVHDLTHPLSATDGWTIQTLATFASRSAEAYWPAMPAKSGPALDITGDDIAAALKKSKLAIKT